MEKKRWEFLFYGVAIWGIFFVSCTNPTQNNPDAGAKEPIYVKGFWDTTGPTTNIRPYKEGIHDFIKEVNAAGGIQGHQIEIEWKDYAYDKDKATAIYEEWRKSADWAKVATIFGWGTNDSYYLSQKAKDDQKAYISASYLGELASPKAVKKTIDLPDGTKLNVDIPGSPYNFFAGTDYSTAIRLALKFVKDSGGEKIVFACCTNAYCKGPLPAAKLYAKELGLKLIINEEKEKKNEPGYAVVEMTQTAEQIDASIKSFIDAYPEAKEDKVWFWLGNTLKTAVFTMKAVAKHAPSAKMIANSWGFGEAVPGLCKDGTQNPCDGKVFGIMPFALFGDLNYPAMKDVVVLHKKWRDKEAKSENFGDTMYVQGYVAFFIWKQAVEKLLASNKPITGANLKEVLEGFTSSNPISTGGLTFPLTFSADDHRPVSGSLIYKVDGDQLTYSTKVNIELKTDWIGW